MADPAPPVEFREIREISLLERTVVARAVSVPFFVMLAASSLAISLALFHLYVAVFGTPETYSFRSTHLAAMLVLAILFNPLFRASIREPLHGATAGETMRRRAGFAIDLLLVVLIVMAQST